MAKRVLSSIRQWQRDMLPLGNDLRALERWANEFDNRIGTIEDATGIRTPTVSGSTLDTEFVAGNGMTGGGFLSYGLLTFNVGAGNGITVNADTIEVDPAIVPTKSGSMSTNTFARWTGANTLSDSTLYYDPTSDGGLGRVGIRTLAPAAILHVIGTTGNQLRLGHDTSNYADITLSSAGAVTLNATGASASWIFSDETVHNAGVDVGTSGRFDSNVDDGAAASSFLFRPTVAQTSGTDRYIFKVDDSSSNAAMVLKADRTVEFNGTNTSGGLISVGGTMPTGAALGISFVPTDYTSTTSVGAFSTANAGARFNGTVKVTGRSVCAGYFDVISATASVTHTNVFAIQAETSRSGNNTITSMGCVYLRDNSGNSKGTLTDWFGIYGASVGTLPSAANRYWINLTELTAGNGNRNSILLQMAGTDYKALALKDQNAWLTCNTSGIPEVCGTVDTYQSVQGLDGSSVANAFKKTADTTVSNTVTETSLVGTGTGTVTLPANFLIIGRTVRVHAAGYYSDAAAPGTIQFRVRLGGVSGTVALNTTALTPAGTVSSQLWEMDAYFTCRTTGATGTIYAQGHVTLHDTTAASRVYEMVNTATVTIDTTAAQAVTPTLQWGTADAANTLTCTNLTVEWL